MLYRPNFCSHCGEKITRAEWTPLTSRRFCDFCAVEQKQHDLLPRAAALLVLLIGAAGITAYFGSGAPASQPTAAAAVSRDGNREARELASRQSQSETSRSTSPSPVTETPQSSAASVSLANSKQRSSAPNSSTEPVYYCGAMTKKGTPCTRRVKTPGRCWQHLGQPAMRSLQE